MLRRSLILFAALAAVLGLVAASPGATSPPQFPVTIKAANGDVVIPIRLTQGDIADMVGASRKRVNQVMVTYKRRGLLAVDDESRITIHDAAGLATYCA